MRFLRKRKAVVHPFTFSAGAYDSGVAEIGEMSGDLRLRRADYVDKVADANLLIGHQVD